MKFPTDDTSTYKLTFKTYLNEYAAGATIANEVYLKNPDGDPVEDSNISDGGYDGSFDFNDNATKIHDQNSLFVRSVQIALILAKIKIICWMMPNLKLTHMP